jgi:hypothetical protein
LEFVGVRVYGLIWSDGHAEDITIYGKGYAKLSSTNTEGYGGSK